MSESMDFQTEVLRRLSKIEQTLVGIDVRVRQLNGEPVTLATWTHSFYDENAVEVARNR